MNRFLLICLFFCSIGISACAQNAGTKHSTEERAQLQTQWMKETLQLTDEQVEQVSALNLTYAQKLEEVKKMDEKLNRLKAFRKLMNEKDNELKNILTPDQFSRYLEKKQELKAKARERAGKYKQTVQ